MDERPLKFTGSSRRSGIGLKPVLNVTPLSKNVPRGPVDFGSRFSDATAGTPTYGKGSHQKQMGTSSGIASGDASTTASAKKRTEPKVLQSQAGKVDLGVANPVQHVNSGLFDQFYAALKENPSTYHVLTLLDSYSSICDEALEKLKSLNARSVFSEIQKKYLHQMINVLTKERGFWRLMKLLYAERMGSSEARECPPEYEVADEKFLMNGSIPGSHHGFEEDDAMGERGAKRSKYVSEKMVVCKRFKSDQKLREWQLILDWLEECARESSTPGEQKIKYFSNTGMLWESTMLHIKSKGPGTDGEIISELDPDAPTRQGKTLLPQDKEDERRFTANLVHFMRTGERDLYEKLCMTVGQPWKMSILIGDGYFHDPNYYSSDPAVLLPAEGNPNRLEWKAATFGTAEDPRLTTGDRHLYAIASRNLQVLLNFADSWEDSLWAYFKCLVDQELEKEIAAAGLERQTKLPNSFWKKDFTPENIFRELEASPKPRVRREAQDPMRKLIKAIVLNDFTILKDAEMSYSPDPDVNENELELVGFDSFLGEWGSCGPQITRFFAHVVLSLQSVIGFGHVVPHRVDDIFAETRLIDYVKFLLESKKLDEVLFYLANVSRESRRQEVLIDVLKQSETDLRARSSSETEYQALRLEFVTKAEDLGLDARAAVKMVVKETRMDCRRDAGVEAAMMSGRAGDGGVDFWMLFGGIKVSDRDIQRINSLDWLLAHGTPGDIMANVNGMARCFLLQRNVRAARIALDKLATGNLVEKAALGKKVRPSLDKTHEIYSPDEKGMREHESLQALAFAFEAFEKWTTFANTPGPKPPLGLEPSFQQASSSSGPAEQRRRLLAESYAQSQAAAAFAAAVEEHRAKYLRLKTQAAEAVKRVLEFPFGWLQDRRMISSSRNQLSEDQDEDMEENEEEATRLREISALKGLYFPLAVQMMAEIHSKECSVVVPSVPGDEKSDGKAKPKSEIESKCGPLAVQSEKIANCQGVWKLIQTVTADDNISKAMNSEQLKRLKACALTKSLDVANFEDEKMDFFGHKNIGYEHIQEEDDS